MKDKNFNDWFQRFISSKRRFLDIFSLYFYNKIFTDFPERDTFKY